MVLGEGVGGNWLGMRGGGRGAPFIPRDGERGKGWGGSVGKGRGKGACRSFWHKGRLVSVTAPRAWSTVHLHVDHHGPSGTTWRRRDGERGEGWGVSLGKGGGGRGLPFILGQGVAPCP